MFGAVVVVAATLVVPARINLRTYTIPCETFFFRQRHDFVVSALCDRANAYRLRATIAIAALLGALALAPLVLESTEARAIWAVTFVVIAAATLAILGTVGTRHQTLFVDL